MPRTLGKSCLLVAAVLVALALLATLWPSGSRSSEAQQGAMQGCPQPGKWAMLVWDGDDGTDTDQALAACGEGAVDAAYYLHPQSQNWLRWFAGRPDVSNLETLGNMQGVIALGGAGALAPTATGSSAQQDAMQNCPLKAKWAISVWSGSDGTAAGNALGTCGANGVDAAYFLDPQTQAWLRWFRDRPDLSNLASLDDLQGVIALGGEGETIVATSSADSGAGTLRQALLDAQSGDTITFDTAAFPPGAPATIYVTSELPHVSQGNLTIDASNAGVILDGGRITGDWVNGLQVYSGGNTVRGLQIVSFTGSGITLCGGDHNTIGGDRSIGAGPLGQGNLTSKNGIGIDLCPTGSHNTLAGNIVGTDATHSDGWGNKAAGIWIENGMTHNTIGPDNIIAYNDPYGIRITGSDAFGNVITQNSIHDNGWTGIDLGDGGNTELAAPLIFDFDLGVGTVAGSACSNCTVEIFSDSGNEGEVYEGQTTADGLGVFSFDKGAPLTGPHLTATATDAGGNTSEFSTPTSGTVESVSLQEANNLPRMRLQPKQSGELEDNRIGIHFNGLWYLQPEAFPDGVLDASHILDLGVKRARFAINKIESFNPQDPIDWSKPELSIDPDHDDFVTSLADNGITMTYVLSFWDKAYKAGGGEILIPRFKTEEEIQRYLDFVRFIVRHFKDRIEYYEIWNEPHHKDTLQWIEVEDYINLVARAVPVIRQEHPGARVQVGNGAKLSASEQEHRDYFFSILRSDIMPLVDIVSWHPMMGESPAYDYSSQYYYEYPSLVREIKDVASAHGFEGEYVADELGWYTPEFVTFGNSWPHSETQCAKYYARVIVMHLGMDVAVSQFNHSAEQVQIVRTIQNLTTIMAGNRPVDLPVTIQSEATNIASYAFSLTNGDHLLALWTDGVAEDDDPGVDATLTLPGFSARTVTGIDVLNGFEQELITDTEGGDLVIRDLLVKDYPIILRFSDVTST